MFIDVPSLEDHDWEPLSQAIEDSVPEGAAGAMAMVHSLENDEGLTATIMGVALVPPNEEDPAIGPRVNRRHTDFIQDTDLFQGMVIEDETP